MLHSGFIKTQLRAMRTPLFLLALFSQVQSSCASTHIFKYQRSAVNKSYVSKLISCYLWKNLKFDYMKKYVNGVESGFTITYLTIYIFLVFLPRWSLNKIYGVTGIAHFIHCSRNSNTGFKFVVILVKNLCSFKKLY